MFETLHLIVAAAMALAAGPLCAARQAAAESRTLGPDEVGPMLSEISPERVRADIDALCGFGTRHTLSDTESGDRGIGAARRWIRGEFEKAAAESGRSGDEAMKVWFDTHRVEPDGRRIDRAVDVVNVMAELPGATAEARERRYYIIAHYDTINADFMNRTDDAPGANDNASGTAALLELARVMSKRRFDATIVFMATAGEEQGLFGARLYARAAREAGLDIRAVLNNDTVGDPAGPFDPESDEAKRSRGTIRVFSEGVPRQAPAQEIGRIFLMGAENDSPARQLARYVAEVAERHELAIRPTLIFRNDRFLRGGDHTGFLEAGFPAAVRFTVMHEDYNRQHQFVEEKRDASGEMTKFGDRAEFVEAAYLADVTRLNGAALAHLASAPRAPGSARIITAELTNDTTLRWEACPEPDVAGYEVVWRETTSAMWTHSQDVGDATEATLPLSKDNWLFGVRAYNGRGFRSQVSFPTAARE
ncbi:MAG: M20/M25/M40 family metallo-hydrolase [Phycisphaeraceae bacterium]|nr:MAG: M20/M25/M40 family metallo-hydrolase [Phycisphaeraceae bacterium]